MSVRVYCGGVLVFLLSQGREPPNQPYTLCPSYLLIQTRLMSCYSLFYATDQSKGDCAHRSDITEVRARTCNGGGRDICTPSWSVRKMFVICNSMYENILHALSRNFQEPMLLTQYNCRHACTQGACQRRATWWRSSMSGG